MGDIGTQIRQVLISPRRSSLRQFKLILDQVLRGDRHSVFLGRESNVCKLWDFGKWDVLLNINEDKLNAKKGLE